MIRGGNEQQLKLPSPQTAPIYEGTFIDVGLKRLGDSKRSFYLFSETYRVIQSIENASPDSAPCSPSVEVLEARGQQKAHSDAQDIHVILKWLASKSVHID